MVKVIWNSIAVKDLEEIEEFISFDSLNYARRTIEKIHSRVFMLHSFPKAGRIVPEFADNHIREIIEGNYRIVYWIKNTRELIILRVHHSARLLH